MRPLSSSLATALALATGLLATAPPAASQEEASSTLMIRAERVIVRPGKVLENASILVQDGVILAVEPGLQAPEGAQVIEGEVVCAGYLDSWSSLGMDTDSLEDSRTVATTRAVDGLDPYSQDHLREEALRAGVTAVRVQAGMAAKISGLGGVVRNHPERGREGLVVLDDACLNMTVGISRDGRYDDVFGRLGEVDRLVSSLETGRGYRESWVEYRYELEEWEAEIAEKEEELEDDFKKAKKDREKDMEEAEEDGEEFKEKRYREDKKPTPPRFNAGDELMARVEAGEVPLVVEIHGAAEVRDLLEKTAPFDRLRLILAGGTEVLPYADQLAQRRVPVIVNPMPMAEPRPAHYRHHDLELAARLDEAGVEVIFGSGGGARTSRDLPLYAALAIAHGLEPDVALEALTLGPARALDVGDRLGSVERGKDADLIVLDGDPLSSLTQVRYVVVQGEVVVAP